MIVIEVWTKDSIIKIVNFYNPGNKLSLEKTEELNVNLGGKVTCGDFNAYSTLWDRYNDGNGEAIKS